MGSKPSAHPLLWGLGTLDRALPALAWPGLPTSLRHSLLGNDVDCSCADRFRVEAARLRDDFHTSPLGEVLGQGSVDHSRHLWGQTQPV